VRPTRARLQQAPLDADTVQLQQAWYAAWLTRDTRFDGRVFVGVTSTGIYCRPVCRVKVPRPENCRFYASAARAEGAGFRPCLRCRPELAPGLAMIDTPQALAQRAALLLNRSVVDAAPLALTDLATRLGVTDRHLRRVFVAAHGVTPLAWVTTQRLLLAKQLLTDTTLPVTQVALASGYASLRRFQAAFAEHYRLTPGALRRGVRGEGGSAAVGESSQAAVRATRALAARVSPVSHADDAPVPRHLSEQNSVMLQLPYRPPYDVAGVLAFWRRRAVPGLEVVQPAQPGAVGHHVLRRSLALDHQGRRLTGWFEASWDETRHEVTVHLSTALAPALGGVRQALRQAFDLDADPAALADTLAAVPGPHHPGLRLPGAFGAAGGFEAAVRVVLGQQISVAAARTLTERLVRELGEQVDTPWPGVSRAFPTAQALVEASPERIGQLGIVRQRVRALQALAGAVVDGLVLDASADVPATLDALLALPGIGDWSAQLIALRALAWPDAFAASDLGVLVALEGPGGPRDVAAARQCSLAWRPWRAYALMKLWQQLETPSP
jgi:AraC family transcriptional regulator of adaptative response / DNA-3-methyladenine glycosylase II